MKLLQENMIKDEYNYNVIYQLQHYILIWHDENMRFDVVDRYE